MPIAQQLGESESQLSPGQTAAEATTMHWLTVPCGAGEDTPGTPDTGDLQPDTAMPSTAASPTVTYSDSQNWAGFQTETSARNTLVDATWIVPSVAKASVKKVSNQWIGIGGCNSSSDLLAQAGVEGDANANGTVNYYPWWELCPYNAVQPIPNFSTGPGTELNVSVQLVSSKHIEFIMSDPFDNTGVDFIKTFPSSYTLGNQADWIEERTKVNGKFPYLANFNNSSFESPQAYQQGASSSANLSSLDRKRFTMMNCGYTTTMVTNEGLAWDSFNQDWAITLDFDSSGDNNACG